MLAQIIRVISSPSKSTTGLATLILEALASVERKLAILLYYANEIKENSYSFVGMQLRIAAKNCFADE